VHPKVVLLARSLERTGGAEQQLTHLARGLHRRGWPVRVVTFYDDDDLAKDLAADGVEVVSLGKAGRWDLVGFAARLRRELRRDHPDVIQSTLTVPNVLAAVLAASSAQVAWGIRASDMDLRHHYDWTHRAAAKLEALLSARPAAIVANSHAGRAVSLQRGFRSDRLVVIANGIDTDRFRPNLAPARAFRERWLAGKEGHLIGMVARLDPMKDHETFLQAARLLVARVPDVRFVCVGNQGTLFAPTIRRRCTDLGLDSHVTWEGPRHDIEVVMNALDLCTLSSAFGEGFPNVIGEAMASETAVVATDVGDAAMLIGSHGRIVPPREPGLLAAAWEMILAMGVEERQRMAAAARQRIVEEFSLDAMVARTAALYSDLAAKRAASTKPARTSPG